MPPKIARMMLMNVYRILHVHSQASIPVITTMVTLSVFVRTTIPVARISALLGRYPVASIKRANTAASVRIKMTNTFVFVLRIAREKIVAWN